MFKKKGWKIVLPVLLALTIGLVLYINDGALVSQDDDILHPIGDVKALFVDVGQGDGAIIYTRNSCIVVDAGEKREGQSMLDALEAIGIQKIDAIVASHPHSDHIGGLAVIVDKYPVEDIYMPKKSSGSMAFENLMESIDEKGYSITAPEPGDTLDFDGFDITFYHPPHNAAFEETNDYSFVFQVQSDSGQTLLMTGDAEKESEALMLSQGYDLRSDVLKVGHHGSHSSTTEEFLAAVSPQIAVISCGLDNNNGHPHKEVRDVLTEYQVQVYRTDQDGSVLVTFFDDGISVDTFS